MLLHQVTGGNKKKQTRTANRLRNAAVAAPEPSKADKSNGVQPPPMGNGNNTAAPRRQSAQLYSKYVGRSSIFGAARDNNNSNKNNGSNVGRWPLKQANWDGPIIRLGDSVPSPAQLEWNKQRRASARSAASMSTTHGHGTGPGGIVHRHAEMRSYLQHCQRVLNARARVDSSLPAKNRRSGSNSLAAPSPAFSSHTWTREAPTGTRRTRAKSVPANAEREGAAQAVWEENDRLLDRLLRIEIRSPALAKVERKQHKQKQ